MTQRLILILLALTLTPIQAGHSVVDMQVGQEVSDAQKAEFIQLLSTLPSQGEFYTVEATRRAMPYLPVLFSLTEKDLEKYNFYAFAAMSAGISTDKERRAYAIAHFSDIRHPLLKLLWAVLLFDVKEASPEIVRYLRDTLDSQVQSRQLKSMVGKEFKFFKRAVRNHPFAQDGSHPAFEEEDGHVGLVSSVAFSPDNKTLLSGSSDGTLILWDVVTNRQLRSIEGHRHNEENPASVTSVAFSPDGKVLLSAASDNTVRFWDAGTGTELRAFHSAHYAEVAIFSPDGKMVAAANCGGIVLLDSLTAKLLRTFRPTFKCVTSSLAFSPDGRTLLSDSGVLQIRNLATGRVVKSFGSDVDGLALSPDGKSVLLGGYTPELWNVVRGRLVHRFPEEPGRVEAVAFSPDGTTVASESPEGLNPFTPGIIKLWDVTTGRELRRLTGHPYRVSSLVFSWDGKWLASGSWDHTVKLWDVNSGEQIRSFPAASK